MDEVENFKIPAPAAPAAPPHLTVDGLVNPSNVGDVLLALRRGEAERGRAAMNARISTWAVTVIFACLAIGFMGSMIESLSHHLGQQQKLANQSKTDAEYAQSQSEDVGKLLADPQTQLVRLTSTTLASANAAIAWNASRHDGALFCDTLPLLPQAQAYEIWAVSPSDQGAKVVDVRPSPGVSVYPFHYSDATARLSRFEVTAGSRDATKPPLLSGTVQQ
jgi:hypothetical protein